MPRLPTYGQQTQETAPLPAVSVNLNVPRGAFGGELGGVLQNIGELGVRRATEMQEENDTNRAIGAFHRVHTQANEYLYGKDDQPGILELIGDNALGMTAAAATTFGEFAKEERALLNERAQRVFDKHWYPAQQRMHKEVAYRESTQRAASRQLKIAEGERLTAEKIARNPLDADAAEANIRGLATEWFDMGVPEETIVAMASEMWNLREDNAVAVLRRTEPEYVLEGLLVGDLYSERTAIWREAEAEKARKIIEARLTAKQAQRTQDREADERALKALQDSLAKTGDALVAEGTLTEEWLAANMVQLRPADYRYFQRKLAGGPDNAFTPSVFADLYVRAGHMEDVRREARLAFTEIDGGLDLNGYTQIMARLEDNRPVDHWAQHMQRDVTRRMGGDREYMRYEDSTRLANAIRDTINYIEDYPESTREEAMARADLIVRANRYISTDEVGQLSYHGILYRVGPYDAPDVAATVRETTAARASGELGLAEYGRQLQYIAMMIEQLEEDAARKEAEEAQKTAGTR